MASVFTAPMIGRESELAQCAALLDRGGPALILISSDAGVGKSRFLHGLAEQSTPAGWTVLPGSGETELSVGPATTQTEFTGRIRHMLGLPASGDPLHGRATLQVAAPGLARQLAARSPVMLLIDGYRPSPSFAAWFERQLMPDVRRTAAPVVFALAEVPGQLSGCMARAAPELVIRLGPLQADTVRSHLTQACRVVEPPLTDDELERYSRAISRDPELLDALVSVLCLGSDDRPAAPGGADA